MTASCHECDADGAPCTHYSQIGAGVAHALFYVLDVLGCHPSSPGDGHHIISHLIASVHLYILAATASVDRTRANQKEVRALDASSHLLRSSPESVMYVCMYVRKSNRTECGERNVVAHVYMLHYATWLRAGGGVRLRRRCWICTAGAWATVEGRSPPGRDARRTEENERASSRPRSLVAWCTSDHEEGREGKRKDRSRTRPPS